MANFRYVGKTSGGVQVEGVIQARDLADASIEVRKTVDIIDSIKEESDAMSFLKQDLKQKANIKSLALVCRQFSIILHAGLPIATTIRMIAKQTEDEYLKKLLLSVVEDVTSGSSIADSFAIRDTSLPTTFVETIRAGEESGKLEVAFDRLATYFTKRAATQGKVKSALIYPIIVLIVAVVVVGILMVKAVPTFKTAFAQLGAELPWVTTALISTSDFFVKWYWLMIIIVFAIIIVFKLITNTEEGKYKWTKFSLKVPVIGKINLMSATSEFANSFATMLASGIPAIKALNITAKAISNHSMSKDIVDSCQLVESGYRICDSLKERTDLPDMLTEIVGVGEESGSLESVLTVMSEYYDEEVDAATRNALTILEPAMILVLAVIVLFVLLAVYLPMFSMYDSI